MTMTFAFRTARAVRVVSVPPVMAAIFFFILYRCRPDVMATETQFLVALGCISLAPLPAYPLSWALEMGREAQRSLAMYLSAAAYAAAFAYSMAAPSPFDYRLICCTYVLSVALLLVFNKGLGLRSSGHACSVTGPIAFMCFIFGVRLIPVCALVYALVLWASLHTRRHTLSEYLWGSACSLLAYLLSYILLNCL